MVWKDWKTYPSSIPERNVKEFNIVAINDLGNIDSNLHLLKI